jgi:hypothetical protein
MNRLARGEWAVRRTLLVVALTALVLQVYVEVLFAQGLSSVGADFLNQIYVAGGDVLSGDVSWLTRLVDDAYTTAPYPPPLVLALSPISFIPQALAVGLWLGILVMCAAVTLRVLGVRDPRCYVAWLFSAPVVVGVYYGNVTLLLVLCLALMWRYRDRPLVCAGAASVLAVVKLWPFVLVLWMLFTGRKRAAAYTVFLASTALLLAWGVLGFAGVGDYPGALQAFSERFAGFGYSLVSLFVHGGMPVDVASALALCAGALFLIPAARSDDTTSLLFVIVAALVASSIVWLHYYAFLIVPLAARSPRFGVLWLYPLSLWMAADLFIVYRQPAGAAAALISTIVFMALDLRSKRARQPSPVLRESEILASG